MGMDRPAIVPASGAELILRAFRLRHGRASGDGHFAMTHLDVSEPRGERREYHTEGASGQAKGDPRTHEYVRPGLYQQSPFRLQD
jgi:hypothetical protein